MVHFVQTRDPSFRTLLFPLSVGRLSVACIFILPCRLLLLPGSRRAVLYALLDPTSQLQAYEAAGRNAQRLALMEEFKSMPFAAVWDKLCEKAGVPVGADWIAEMEAYEQEVLSARG